ncbi:hypothetical protein LTR15_008410 [Elasticomyces elasticus]|nr:hypothetical protein LTR15_008410 [Elasticomyces elasticus]
MAGQSSNRAPTFLESIRAVDSPSPHQQLYCRTSPSQPQIAMATRGSKRKAGDEELVELPEDEELDEEEEEYDESDVGSDVDDDEEVEEEEDPEAEPEEKEEPVAQPKAKKQKTEQPKASTKSAKKDEPVGEDDDDVDPEELEDEEDLGSDDVEDEDADDTAAKSGPTASAKARKGGQVPKEAELAEVDDED